VRRQGDRSGAAESDGTALANVRSFASTVDLDALDAVIPFAKKV